MNPAVGRDPEVDADDAGCNRNAHRPAWRTCEADSVRSGQHGEGRATEGAFPGVACPRAFASRGLDASGSVPGVLSWRRHHHRRRRRLSPGSFRCVYPLHARRTVSHQQIAVSRRDLPGEPRNLFRMERHSPTALNEARVPRRTCCTPSCSAYDWPACLEADIPPFARRISCGQPLPCKK